MNTFVKLIKTSPEIRFSLEVIMFYILYFSITNLRYKIKITTLNKTVKSTVFDKYNIKKR